MPISTKVSGAFKNVTECHVKVSGAWKKCSQVYVKVNGEWKPVLVGSNQVQFIVNTQAMISGSKKSAVPFQLYGQSGITLTVDWGDGSTSTLTSSQYTVDNSTASVHTYSTAGTYTITITSNNWPNTYWFACGNLNSNSDHNGYAAVYWFTRTVIGINSAIPKIKGCNSYISNYGSIVMNEINTHDNSIASMFQYCEKLTSIPGDLLDNLVNITSADSLFENCTSLSTIPSSLFVKNTNLTSVISCFEDCSSLGDFTLNIPAANITSVFYFVTYKSGTTRIVKVPNNSTTKTKFNNEASSLGLTVQNL